MNSLYKFQHNSLTEDQINPQGKITKYLEVYIAADSEESAMVKGKLSEEYTLIEVKELGKGWN